MDQTFRRPFQIALMRFGPVGLDGGKRAGLVAAGMAGHAFAAMKDFDGHGRIADIEFAMDQSVGDTVVVTIDFDVVPELCISEGSQEGRGEKEPFEDPLKHRVRARIAESQLRDVITLRRSPKWLEAERRISE